MHKNKTYPYGEYDKNGNIIYCRNLNGHWYKVEYDNNRNKIYYEYVYGYIRIGNWDDGVEININE